MRKRVIIIILVIAAGLFSLWIGYLWKFFSCDIAGSDPCAEHWILNTSESNLIKVINAVKKEHPELKPPYESIAIPEKRNYWYDFTFYYSDTNEDVQTWIRATEDSNFTAIALIAIYQHTDSLTPINEMNPFSRKEINRDYNYFSNKMAISKFKSKVLSLLRKKIEDNN